MGCKYPFIELPRDYFKIKHGDEWKHEISKYDNISYSTTKVDRYEFPIFRKELNNANILEVVAGTTGYQGGDSGHGCRTFIRIRNLGGTDIRIDKVGKEYSDEGVEIVLGGDTELYTIIDGLEFIINVLKTHSDGCLISKDQVSPDK